MKEKKQNDLSVLLGYAGTYKGLTFLGLGLSGIAMILGMLPYICIWLAARDLIEAAPDWTIAVGISRYGWMAFCFSAVGIAVYFAALMCTHLAAFRTASNIRKTGMEHLMKTPLGFFDSNASGLLRNRLDGAASETETLLAHNLADIVGSAAMVIAMVVLMFVFDWRMGAACLLTDYAMFFQDVVLFDDTVMENIRLGKHGASDKEVLAAAKAANCDEFVDKLPQGYNTPIGENGAKLSGGERQRISIARALLKGAPIILLDEATASLDVENETKVQGALSRLLEGKTVLVIAHRMRTVEAADKIIVLVDGKVAEEGRPNDLLVDENSIFRHMTQLQAASAGWSI